ncbi:MAG: type III-A CRISPR-associated RAMP protein Csm5 [Brevinematia bacterium]
MMKILLYKVPVTKSFKQSFKEKLDDINNQLIVNDIYRSKDDYSPVIPGSSIKGAIRTAIVSTYGESKNKEELFEREKPKTNFENIILNCKGAKDDPFRAIHISDCKISGKNNQLVCKILNYKPKGKRGNCKSKMQIIMELITGVYLGGNATGEFELTIDDALQNIKLPESNNKTFIELKLNVEEIIEKCDKFYKNHLAEESRKFYKDSPVDEIKKMSAKLLTKVKEICTSNNECLIRVGRHSHFENVTIDKHRIVGPGSSRFLMEENFFPLGFAKLRFEKV